MKHLRAASTTILASILVAACSSADPSSIAATQNGAPVQVTGDDALIADAEVDQDMIDTFSALHDAGWLGETSDAFIDHTPNGDLAAFPFTYGADKVSIKVVYTVDATDPTKRISMVVPSNDAAQKLLTTTLDDEPAVDILSDSELAQLVPEPEVNEAVGFQTESSMCGTLVAGKSLTRGQRITSCHNGYYLEMQTDGNLVVYTKYGHALWATGTNGKGGYRAAMQTDGNFVVYNASNKALWATGHRVSGDWIHLKDNGELIRDTCGTVHWRDNQYCDNPCQGMACKSWGCGYDVNGGFNPACLDPNDGNYTGAYHYHVWRKGHTVPGFCGTGLYADYRGDGISCPTTHVLKVFYCGAP